MQFKEYQGYKFYEDGTVIGLYGKPVKTRTRNNRIEIKLQLDGKRKNYTLSRILYFVFFPFDITDRDLCISYKDNNSLNVHIDNLYLTHRKDLIQGDGHVNRIAITEQQAEEIRQLYKGKPSNNQYNKDTPSLNDLAIKYNTTKANIKMIVKGNSRNPENYKLK